jgi:hypothetical protein
MPGTKLDRRATIRVRAKLEAAGGSDAMVRSSLAVRKQFLPDGLQTEFARKYGKLATALSFPTA